MLRKEKDCLFDKYNIRKERGILGGKGDACPPIFIAFLS